MNLIDLHEIGKGMTEVPGLTESLSAIFVAGAFALRQHFKSKAIQRHIAAGEPDNDRVEMVDLAINPTGEEKSSYDFERYLQTISSSGNIDLEDVFGKGEVGKSLLKDLDLAIELALKDTGKDVCLPFDYLEEAIFRRKGDVEKTLGMLQSIWRSHFGSVLSYPGTKTNAGLGEREVYVQVAIYPILVVRNNRYGGRQLQLYLLPKDRMNIRPNLKHVSVLNKDGTYTDQLDSGEMQKILLVRNIADRVMCEDPVLKMFGARVFTGKVEKVPLPPICTDPVESLSP